MSIENRYNVLVPEKERLNKIESVLNSVPDIGSKDFTIMYLLVYLSQFFQRDPEYFLMSPKEQYQVYSKDFKSVRDKSDQLVVCKTLCEQYKKYFDKFGIKSQIIKLPTKSYVPLFSMLVEGDDGKTFYVDPLLDLHKNQFGLRMDYFGYYLEAVGETIHNFNKDTIQLTPEYKSQLESLFSPSFYCNEDKIKDMYNFYKCHLCNGNISSIRTDDNERLNSINQKIQLLSNCIINLNAFGRVNGIIERRKFYHMLLNRYTFFTRREKNSGNGIKFFINRKEEEKTIECIVYDLLGKERFHFREEYSEESNQYCLRPLKK